MIFTTQAYPVVFFPPHIQDTHGITCLMGSIAIVYLFTMRKLGQGKVPFFASLKVHPRLRLFAKLPWVSVSYVCKGSCHAHEACRTSLATPLRPHTHTHTLEHTHTRIRTPAHTHANTHMYTCTHKQPPPRAMHLFLYTNHVCLDSGVASISRNDKIIGPFANEPYKGDYILQKRPVI